MNTVLKIADRVELRSTKSIAKSLWGRRGTVSLIIPRDDTQTRYRVKMDAGEVVDCSFKSLTLDRDQLVKI